MNDIYRAIIWILCATGGVTIASIIVVIISWLGDIIPDRIKKWKRKRQIKNRFDKPPTAKCYCIDCLYHDKETGQCWTLTHGSNYYTDDYQRDNFIYC